MFAKMVEKVRAKGMDSYYQEIEDALAGAMVFFDLDDIEKVIHPLGTYVIVAGELMVNIKLPQFSVEYPPQLEYFNMRTGEYRYGEGHLDKWPR